MLHTGCMYLFHLSSLALTSPFGKREEVVKNCNMWYPNEQKTPGVEIK